jgi:F0F1-type ATP synthase membrane subunit c/vacuolar-type H+-ATPase subunit K
MDMSAAKMIGAGLAMLALLGVGIGLGNIFSNLITAMPATLQQKMMS